MNDSAAEEWAAIAQDTGDLLTDALTKLAAAERDLATLRADLVAAAEANLALQLERDGLRPTNERLRPVVAAAIVMAQPMAWFTERKVLKTLRAAIADAGLDEGEA